ncbi:rhodanese-like domain-containing protein [Sulfurovum sp.]|jgi:rhodanese-related sulfurtransferase|uniref:rhodanese-like domain-containing protein n=1 Tax=Sulfurovum sp. TaxID=1969726 RepID=UPI0025E3573D|nr:rhodanese-like domain-containing protein [Sulfurovum sp.]
MKNRLLLTAAALLFAVSANAYDATKAGELNSFYSHMTQKACADSKLFVKAKDVMKLLKENKPVALLDVRTDGEASVIALSGENALHIPIEKLFEKNNLDKIPTDKPVMVVCHSGTRATLAAIGLKRIGFKNVHVIKGGLIALAEANNPKNAPLK